ncbi:MAG: hypothetical protein K2W99_05810 [Chthoniobacterales bacterium]|nr:hypothetical protein [Chthoniobacterales bacterium]
MRRLNSYLFLLLVLWSLLASEALIATPLWETLNKNQQELLTNGKQVVVEEPMPGMPWPTFHVYHLVAATPLQAVAVFWDVQDAPHYVPDCLSVSIEEVSTPNLIVMTYELRVPFFPKEVTKVRDEFKELSNGGYQVSWEMLGSTYSKSGRGNFIAIPHGEGALICYSNFVNPGSAIAVILRHPAQERIAKTAASIAHQIEYEVQKAPQKLASQVEHLQKILKK